MKQNKKVIGITGDIGSGKSTVSNYIINKGYKVIDADKVARIVIKEKDVLHTISKAFDNVVKDNELDRTKLAEIVFGDRVKLKKLNAIMHPAIVKYIKNEVRQSDENYIFIDAALLYEVGLDSLCDEVIYIDMPLEKRLERIMKRDHTSKELTLKKMNSFRDDAQKKRDSIVIHNDNDFQNLYIKVNTLLNKLTR